MTIGRRLPRNSGFKPNSEVTILRRFFTEPENINENTAVILEDAAHIKKVLRMNPGDEILIFDGSGREYTARLSEIGSDRCLAEIISAEMSKQEPTVKVTVFQAVPKSGKMEGIIQKAVELGVTGIVPVAADRCVSRLDGGKREAEKLKRWNKVAVEAAKQCGRGILPRVEPCIGFKAAIERMKESGLALMPYEMLGHDGVSNLKDILDKSDSADISIIIGPEGGFSDSEADYALKSGIVMVGLGHRILRTETVSSMMLSIIMYAKNSL